MSVCYYYKTKKITKSNAKNCWAAPHLSVKKKKKSIYEPVQILAFRGFNRCSCHLSSPCCISARVDDRRVTLFGHSIFLFKQALTWFLEIRLSRWCNTPKASYSLVLYITSLVSGLKQTIFGLIQRCRVISTTSGCTNKFMLYTLYKANKKIERQSQGPWYLFPSAVSKGALLPSCFFKIFLLRVW